MLEAAQTGAQYVGPSVLGWGGGGGRGLSRKGDRSRGVQKQLKTVSCMAAYPCTH